MASEVYYIMEQTWCDKCKTMLGQQFILTECKKLIREAAKRLRMTILSCRESNPAFKKNCREIKVCCKPCKGRKVLWLEETKIEPSWFSIKVVCVAKKQTNSPLHTMFTHHPHCKTRW